MISFLANRHYLQLTKAFPSDINHQVPSTVYYKTFMNPKTLKLLSKEKDSTTRIIKQLKTKKFEIKKKKPINISMEDLDACPLCFQKHIDVDYYSHRHICLKCRGFLRDQHGNQTKIFLNEEGKIVCLGIKAKQVGQKRLVYYYTDYMKLQASGYPAFATFAGDRELVVLLRQKGENIMGQNR